MDQREKIDETLWLISSLHERSLIETMITSGDISLLTRCASEGQPGLAGRGCSEIMRITVIERIYRLL
jgi:hypothetical protein